MQGAVPCSGLLCSKLEKGEEKMGNNYDNSIHRMVCGNARKTEEVKTPKHLCQSCSKCVENRCTFYNRPIVKDYNRCFNHSHYAPVTVAFKAPDNLEELVREEEKQIA